MIQQQIHAVAIPLALQGHLNSLMRFCKALASHHPGLIITFVNIDPMHHRIAQLNAADASPVKGIVTPPLHGAAAASQDKEGEEEKRQPQQPPPQAHLDNIRHVHIPVEGLDLSNDFRLSLKHMFEALRRHMGPPLERLLHKLNRDGPPVTCLISDFGISDITQRLADQFHIPHIVLYPCSASVLLLTLHVSQGDHVSMKEVEEALRSRRQQKVFCDGLMGLPTIYNTDLVDFTHVMDENAYMWKHNMIGLVQVSLSKAHAVVVNSFEDVEGSALRALSEMSKIPVYGVGPLVDSLLNDNNTSLWKEDESSMVWLNEQPAHSVLYIAFGSFTILSQVQFEEIVAGLVASEQHFLWVFRPDLIENSPCGAFPADLLLRTQGKGCVVAWAPQVRVLSHASVGGFLTHCGWNSVIEGLSHGVPMLCWPYNADQFMNAKYVVDEWKVGLRFDVENNDVTVAIGELPNNVKIVKRDEVERVIRILMQAGEALCKNALQLKEAGHRSLHPVEGKSRQHFETLIQSL